MGAAVIVAIPEQDSYVWKISSEKIPHLTLLYLGEDMPDEQATRVAEFLDHAAKNLNPFWMDVDYRGELGDDKADVLFFKKSWAKNVETFRAQLRGNPEIAKAYNSAEQYPEWVPHLTLGYPETPAKPDDRDYPGINSVSFDRVALWVGDFEGPEFRLEHEDDYAGEVAMSDNLEGFLAHHGVVSLKHAVVEDIVSPKAPALSRFERVEKTSTKNRTGSGDFDESKVKRDKNGKFSKKESRMSKAEFLAQLDREWESPTNLQKMLADAQDKVSVEKVEKVNDLTQRNLAGEIDDEQFVSEARKIEVDLINKNLAVGEEAYSPSGTKSARAEWRDDKLTMYTYSNPNSVHRSRVDEMYKQYVESDIRSGNMRANNDALIEESRIRSGSQMAHGTEGEVGMSDNLEGFLAHYGIKGMRWGFRRTDAQLARARSSESKKTDDDDSTDTSKSSGGGRSAEPSADAIKFAELSLKQPVEMSNSEIKLLTERARLTSEYNKIFANSSANNELREKVESMRLEREYKQLKAQMTPPSKIKSVGRAVGNLVKSSAAAYGHFKTLDKATGGAMSKELKVGLGLQSAYKGRHVAKVSKKTKTKKK